jgi:arginyl-tRNA synthetase
MPIRDQLADAVSRALATVAAAGSLELSVDPAEIHLERPARREHGDWSTNIAMVSAKRAGTTPRAVAESLVGVLTDHP